jgi:hypothetical protein
LAQLVEVWVKTFGSNSLRTLSFIKVGMKVVWLWGEAVGINRQLEVTCPFLGNNRFCAVAKNSPTNHLPGSIPLFITKISNSLFIVF